MPDLILPERTQERLRQLLSNETEAPATGSSSNGADADACLLSQDVQDELLQALETPRPAPDNAAGPASGKLTGSSPAVPPPLSRSSASAAATKPPEKAAPVIVVGHKLLHSISEQIRTTAASCLLESAGIDPDDYTLHSLIRGARLYFEPKPKFVRSHELEASLARIRRQLEEDEYQAMVSSPDPTGAFSAFKQPIKPYEIKWSRPTSSVVPHERQGHVLTQAEEQLEWAKTKAMLSAIANVLLSMAAVATAVWWAAGNVNIAWKAIVAILAALLIAATETVLYMRYFRNEEARRQRKEQMNVGTDVPAKKVSLPDEATMQILREKQQAAIKAYLASKTAEAPASEIANQAPTSAAGDGRLGATAAAVNERHARQRKKGKK